MARTRKPASKISAGSSGRGAEGQARRPTDEGDRRRGAQHEGVSLKGATPGQTIAAILATSPDFGRVVPGVYCLTPREGVRGEEAHARAGSAAPGTRHRCLEPGLGRLTTDLRCT